MNIAPAATTSAAATAATTGPASAACATATAGAAGATDAFAALLGSLAGLAPDGTAGAAVAPADALPGGESLPVLKAAEEETPTAGADFLAALVLPETPPAAGIALPWLAQAAAVPAQPADKPAPGAPGGLSGAALALATPATGPRATPAGTDKPGAAPGKAEAAGAPAPTFALPAAAGAETPAAKAAPSKALAELAAAADMSPAQATPMPDAPVLPAPLAAAPAPQALAASAPAGPVHQASLPSHPGLPAFAGDLAAEVRVMLQGGLQQAELRLNPADLGPIHIQLNVTAQTADISFAAAHGATREGIAQALPELREMLSGEGLSLGQTGVGSGQDSRPGGQQAQGGDAPRPFTRLGTADAAADTSAPAARPAARASRGMLDLYA